MFRASVSKVAVRRDREQKLDFPYFSQKSFYFEEEKSSDLQILPAEESNR